jgi:hypothetical protein
VKGGNLAGGTQEFSPRFMGFARELAERWVRDYDLADRTVLEFGCGKGEFLIEMAKAGAGHCIGIDPGVHPERIDDPAADGIEWIADFYDERYTHLDADVVICRHTLEHIPNVAEFMTTIRESIGDRPDTSESRRRERTSPVAPRTFRSHCGGRLEGHDVPESDVGPMAAVVDVNPRKAGAGVPGTSLTIGGPGDLVAVEPRTVIVANPLYRDGIAETLAGLGVDAELQLLWSRP